MKEAEHLKRYLDSVEKDVAIITKEIAELKQLKKEDLLPEKFKTEFMTFFINCDTLTVGDHLKGLKDSLKRKEKVIELTKKDIARNNIIDSGICPQCGKNLIEGEFSAKCESCPFELLNPDNDMTKNLDIEKIKKTATFLEKGCRSRLLRSSYVKDAYKELLKQDKYEEIRIESGRIANCYKGRAFATYVYLHRSGDFIMTRKEAKKEPYGSGHTWTFRHQDKKFVIEEKDERKHD